MSKNSTHERLKLLLAYDGAAFEGWQSQPSGNAVQDKLEQVLASIFGSRIVVHGSGRTDTGVHALGQVAHIDVPRGKFDLRTWQMALNGNLPPAVRVLRVTRARPDFHARFSAQGKIYVYRLWTGPVMHPLELGRAWHVPVDPDLDLLKKAAQTLSGTHDFAGFAANRGHVEKDTVRTIHGITVKKRGPLIELRFSGTGFLYRMVRLLTGSMVRVAQGRAPLAWLEDLLQRKTPGKSTFAAPAEGLFLVRVLYG